MKAEKSIEHILNENRLYKPSIEFAQNATVGKSDLQQMYADANEDLEGFWAKQAQKLEWFKEWNNVLEWKAPYASWFSGGKTNICFNCVDRIVQQGDGDKTALIWEGEPGEVEKVTYRELLVRVSRFSNCLKDIGIVAGDRVALYMPMVTEAVVAMLACARIGAVHTVIFGGFSPEAIQGRVNDASAKLIITADGGYRRGKVVPLKDNVDKACQLGMPSLQNVIVLQRTKHQIDWNDRDLWWHDLYQVAAEECPAAELDSEHPLFTLYTSGTTGKPKGILHTTGGYMVQTNFSARLVFDLKADDVYWCTADVGWITGHSYIVYGLLSNAATVLLYEGSPDFPEKDRFWDIIDRHAVTIFYTAPTAIRAFMKWGDQYPNKYELSSLRLLGSVGEPINPESWVWYHSIIGKENCPIVDTWWQTETGSILIAPTPGVTELKPGSATFPLPGIDAAIVDSEGKECAADQGGYLVIRKPWPSMLRGIYNDQKRYEETYWSQYKGFYFTGDGARRDKDGYFWVLGRVDDVINVSGHRIGTAEIESSLVEHHAVAEAAVVGAPDEIKGEAIYAYVTLRAGMEEAGMPQELTDFVAEKIGSFAKPKHVIITSSLPKTRSGKIMRRLLRKIASREEMLGDTTTLEDKGVVEELLEKVKNLS